jgi:hypothetical protein
MATARPHDFPGLSRGALDLRSLGRLWSKALLTLCAVLLGVEASAQERIDKVEYWLRPREGARTTRTGVILEESPAKVVLRLLDGERLEIPAEQVIDVDYDGAPAAVILARGTERTGQWEQARQHYEKALKELKPGARGLEVHLRFKLADLAFQEAQGGDADQLDRAVAALRHFLQDHPQTRHALPAWLRLGQALAARGSSVDEAINGLNELKEKVKDQPGFAARCDLLALRLLMLEAHTARPTKPAAARQRSAQALAAIEALQKQVKGPELLELRRLRALALAGAGQGDQAVAEIEALLAAAEDDRARAQLFIDRGDVRRILNQPADARWDYLRVELLFPQERELQRQALERLAEVFTELGETARARDYRQRIKR